MKFTNCEHDHGFVGEIRQCGNCQRNGNAGAIHCQYSDATPTERLRAESDPGAFPWESAPEPAMPATIPVPKQTGGRPRKGKKAS